MDNKYSEKIIARKKSRENIEKTGKFRGKYDFLG